MVDLIDWISHINGSNNDSSRSDVYAHDTDTPTSSALPSTGTHTTGVITSPDTSLAITTATIPYTIHPSSSSSSVTPSSVPVSSSSSISYRIDYTMPRNL